MAANLYKKLKQLQINLEVIDGRLEIQAPENILTSQLLDEIKLHKPELIDLISFIKGGGDQYNDIPKGDARSYYPLSSAQKRLWVLSKFAGGSSAYNICKKYQFCGVLDKDILEKCFHVLVERHDILRTVFTEDDLGEVKQRVKSIDEINFNLTYSDLRSEREPWEKVKGAVKADMKYLFDLGAGPLLHASLYQVEDDKYVFVNVIHHIVSDGWSLAVMINEVLSLYNAFAQGKGNPLKSLRINYQDYTLWLQNQLSGPNLALHRSYWMDQFRGELPILELPLNRTRPAIKTYNGAAISRRIDINISKGIKNLCNANSCTLFMGLLASVNVLLYRYTSQLDIIIGSPIAGRDHLDLEDQIGIYANTLAFRTQFNGSDNYLELLENIKGITLGAYNHQVYPFDEIVRDLNIQRDLSRNPLFDVEVILQNIEPERKVDQQNLGQLKVSGYNDVTNETSRFDLIFNFAETNEELYLGAEYNSDLFNQETVVRMAAHLEQIMGAIVKDPAHPICELEYIDSEEKHVLLEQFNNSKKDYPKETIVDLFEEQVKKTPDHIAVHFENITLSYKELNEKSNQLANYLRNEYKIQPESLIGIMVDRSEKMIISMLAVLKAGGAYVPIDPDYPDSRKEFIINDSGIKVLISETNYIFDISYYNHHIFAIDVQLDTITTSSQDLTGGIVLPCNLAYVIYTSGSTGQPKGVMVEHSSIANTIFSQRELFGIKETDRNLQFASSSFDASISEIFITLVSGASLYIINELVKKDTLLLEQYITEHKIDFATFPPAYLKVLDIEKIRTLKKMVTAGESAPVDKAVLFSNTGIYYNAYGPTETSICASIFRYDKTIEGESLPIGFPIANTRIYILDEGQNLTPAGVIGEICISGAGVSRGYLNNVKLTSEKFVKDPFNEGERMYRSGDMGCWLFDGKIEFKGRKDRQVKLHGYRIELGEIETTLEKYPGIDLVTVLIKTNKILEKELVAFIVSKEKLNILDLRSYLLKALPAYMVPGHFVQLESIPLTSNGKIDVKALPDHEGIIMDKGFSYVAPRNLLEEKLVIIWQNILAKEKIGIKDDFFVLGGHSLIATKLISQIHKEFGVKIDINHLFEDPTIEHLSNCINTMEWLDHGMQKIIKGNNEMII